MNFDRAAWVSFLCVRVCLSITPPRENKLRIWRQIRSSQFLGKKWDFLIQGACRSDFLHPSVFQRAESESDVRFEVHYHEVLLFLRDLSRGFIQHLHQFTYTEADLGAFTSCKWQIGADSQSNSQKWIVKMNLNKKLTQCLTFSNSQNTKNRTHTTILEIAWLIACLIDRLSSF